jgi:hypothetical protein
MRCSAARQAMAVYRDLGASERRRVEEHVASCASCARALEAYRRQDEMLGALAEIAPRPAWIAEVRRRTVARPAAAAASLRRWVPVAAIALLIFLSGSLGTIQATNQSLPGDWLYPVKRTVEQVRLSFIRSEQPRSQYLERVRSTRLEETREVLALGREAEVEFEAPYSGRDGSWWTIDGLRVLVPPEVWPGDAPPSGAPLRVRARASDGTLKASAIHVRPTAVPPGGALIEHGAGMYPTPVLAQEGPAAPTPTPAEPSPPAEAVGTPEPAQEAASPEREEAASPEREEAASPEREAQDEPPAAPDAAATETPQPGPDAPETGEGGAPGNGNNRRRPHGEPEVQPPPTAGPGEPRPADSPPDNADDERPGPPDHARGRGPRRTPPGHEGRDDTDTTGGAAQPATEAPETPEASPPDASADSPPGEPGDEERRGNRPEDPPGQAVAEERREEHGRPENPGAARGRPRDGEEEPGPAGDSGPDRGEREDSDGDRGRPDDPGGHRGRP